MTTVPPPVVAGVDTVDARVLQRIIIIGDAGNTIVIKIVVVDVGPVARIDVQTAATVAVNVVVQNVGGIARTGRAVNAPIAVAVDLVQRDVHIRIAATELNIPRMYWRCYIPGCPSPQPTWFDSNRVLVQIDARITGAGRP